MKKSFFILVCGILFFSCKEQNIEPKLSDNFCSNVSWESVDGTISIINNYLNSLDKNLSDSLKLEKLVESLKQKSCIASAQLVCYQCIYTLPAMSEIYVTFKFDDGGTNFMNLCLKHEPLQATVYHQIMTDN